MRYGDRAWSDVGRLVSGVRWFRLVYSWVDAIWFHVWWRLG